MKILRPKNEPDQNLPRPLDCWRCGNQGLLPTLKRPKRADNALWYETWAACNCGWGRLHYDAGTCIYYDDLHGTLHGVQVDDLHLLCQIVAHSAGEVSTWQEAVLRIVDSDIRNRIIAGMGDQ